MAALMTFGKRARTHAAGPGSLEALTDPARVAARAGLAYLSDDAPGFRRVRCGTGFTFRTPDGATLDRDGADRGRVDALVIPPAWEDVWVCPDPRGHLQATGRDAAGRKQYLYHPDWHAAAGAAKWLRVSAFGRALPRLRRRVRGRTAAVGRSTSGRSPRWRRRSWTARPSAPGRRNTPKITARTG